MKGLKVRVQQSDVWAAMVRALGAVPISLPNDRIHLSLRAGLVDAVESTLSTYVASHHYEAAKFYSLTRHSMAPGVLIFSKKVWDGLSRDDQTIIRAAAKESVPHMRKLWDEYEVSARKVVEASGAQIISDVDRQSFSDVLMPLYPMLVTDARLQDMVKRLRAAD